jgi:hypothetical protein
LVGLLLVIDTIPNLGALVVQVFVLLGTEPLDEEQWFPIGIYVGTLAQLLAGGLIFLRAARIAAWCRSRWSVCERGEGQPG